MDNIFLYFELYNIMYLKINIIFDMILLYWESKSFVPFDEQVQMVTEEILPEFCQKTWCNTCKQVKKCLSFLEKGNC